MNQKLMDEFSNFKGRVAFKDSQYSPFYTEWLEQEVLKIRKKIMKKESEEAINKADADYDNEFGYNPIDKL